MPVAFTVPSTYSRTVEPAGARPVTPVNVGDATLVTSSVVEAPLSVAGVISGVEGPVASGAVQGAAGPGTSPNSYSVPSTGDPRLAAPSLVTPGGSIPSHNPRDCPATA